MKKKITLITGGAGSGKTSYALKLAENFNLKAYIATAEITDEEMLNKVNKHKSERDKTYTTYEYPLDLSVAFNKINQEVIILDCITFWVNNILYYKKDFEKYFTSLIDILHKQDKRIIIVTNEVSVGVVPADNITRDYVKKVAKVNRKIAEIADEVYLMVSGIPVKIK